MGAEGAVDLVGGDVHEAGDFRPAGRFQQVLGAHDVGGDERERVADGTVDMGLGREMDHCVEAETPHQLRNQGLVTDVAVHEMIAPVQMRGLDLGQVAAVAGVGQLVQVDDDHIGVGGQHVLDEIGTDEAAATGDEQMHGELLFLTEPDLAANGA